MVYESGVDIIYLVPLAGVGQMWLLCGEPMIEMIASFRPLTLGCVNLLLRCCAPLRAETTFHYTVSRVSPKIILIRKSWCPNCSDYCSAQFFGAMMELGPTKSTLSH
jgi:hypothetical protein